MPLHQIARQLSNYTHHANTERQQSLGNIRPPPESDNFRFPVSGRLFPVSP